MADTCWLSIHYSFFLFLLLTKYQHHLWDQDVQLNACLLVLSCRRWSQGPVLSTHLYVGFSCAFWESLFCFLDRTRHQTVPSHSSWFCLDCGKKPSCIPHIENLRKNQHPKEEAEKDRKSMTYCGHFPQQLYHPNNQELLTSGGGRNLSYSWLNTFLTESLGNKATMFTTINIIYWLLELIANVRRWQKLIKNYKQ